MAKIFIFDEFNPEDMAMLQALYSRSPESVVEHVKKVKQTGSGKFMEQFYIGYNHKSIADCGSTTLFNEKLSILADKAIQDWPLYSGQETSTRYINMAKQPLIDPIANSVSKKIHERWMEFYIGSQEEMEEYLKRKYPIKSGEADAVYEKAVHARVFDSLRGFLPAGITTQLSWHTNLRQASDKLCWLRHNPVEEISNVAEIMLKKLKKKYPHSFSHKLYKEREDYFEYVAKRYNFYYNDKSPEFACRTQIKRRELKKYGDILRLRPEKTDLPHFLTELGNITFDFLLDFGSFRDIQRHRNGVCRMPLLTTNLGFNSWYLEQLPGDLRQKADSLIKEQTAAIKKLKEKPEVLQYYIAMGFNVSCRVSYGLPATVYVVELRSSRTVHPTLRRVAHKMHNALRKMLPQVKLYCDLNPDDWDTRRGIQDIIVKR